MSSKRPPSRDRFRDNDRYRDDRSYDTKAVDRDRSYRDRPRDRHVDDKDRYDRGQHHESRHYESKDDRRREYSGRDSGRDRDYEQNREKEDMEEERRRREREELKGVGFGERSAYLENKKKVRSSFPHYVAYNFTLCVADVSPPYMRHGHRFSCFCITSTSYLTHDFLILSFYSKKKRRSPLNFLPLMMWMNWTMQQSLRHLACPAASEQRRVSMLPVPMPRWRM